MQATYDCSSPKQPKTATVARDSNPTTTTSRDQEQDPFVANRFASRRRQVPFKLRVENEGKVTVRRNAKLKLARGSTPRSER